MTDSRPFVDRRVTDIDAADAVARRVAADAGLPAPERIRVGMNAIYATADVVLRVGHATAPAAAAHELVRVLLAHDIPTAAPVADLAFDTDGFTVTGWVRAFADDAPVGWREVGRAIAATHQIDRAHLPSEYPIPSPAAFPWWNFAHLMSEVHEHIDVAALTGLQAALDRHSGWRDLLEERAVVCHGDVHPGNVVMTCDGPLLIDWDLLSWAPAAWDHAMLTTYASRWGGDSSAYREFARGYGVSLIDDQVTQAIAELRNVAATLMRVRAGITEPAAQAEAERRLRYWRGELDAPVWRAQ